MTLTITTNADEVDRWLVGKQKNLPKTMARAQKETGREVLRRYRRTSSTWSHKPEYEVLTEARGASVTLLAGTDDSVWNMLDVGTRPHTILPKRPGGFLRFQGGYNAKTTPGSLRSGRGGPFGNVVFSRGVRHPGTKARNWTTIILNEMNTLAPKIMQRNLRRWAR